MSDSDTSSDANWALRDVNHGIVKGQDARSKYRKRRKPSKKPAKGNKFIWDWEALAATILLLLFLMALAYLVVTSVYSFLFHDLLGTARHSTINMVHIPTGKPATATVTTTTTETVTVTANRQEPTQTTIGGFLKIDPPPADVEGVPRSMGFWKHLAREVFYEECFRGCVAGAGCSLTSEGRWERACRQTDLLIRDGVDCSATNLMVGEGGKRILFPDIPEACLDSLARHAKNVRIEDLRKRGAYRGP